MINLTTTDHYIRLDTFYLIDISIPVPSILTTPDHIWSVALIHHDDFLLISQLLHNCLTLFSYRTELTSVFTLVCNAPKIVCDYLQVSSLDRITECFYKVTYTCIGGMYSTITLRFVSKSYKLIALRARSM